MNAIVDLQTSNLSMQTMLSMYKLKVWFIQYLYRAAVAFAMHIVRGPFY